MKIKQIIGNKKQYIELLLCADPSEEMIDRYLEESEMFVMEENGAVICEAVVLPLTDTVCELKNIAVVKEFWRKGYGSKMLAFLFANYGGWCEKIIVGTADDGGTFYEKNGFVYSHSIKNFFTDNYEEPLLSEDGNEYKDMHYYKKSL